MGKASRDKGKRGERELANRLRKYGYDTRRGQQYSGANGDADVVGLPDIHIECKRINVLDIKKAMAQAMADAKPNELPAVFSRKDHGQWLVHMRVCDLSGLMFGNCFSGGITTMTLDDWIKVYREWQAVLHIDMRDEPPTERLQDV